MSMNETENAQNKAYEQMFNYMTKMKEKNHILGKNETKFMM